MKTKGLNGAFLCSALLFGAAASAHATAFTIDSFTVERNGSVLFQDTFDNGDPMNTDWTFNNGNTAFYETIPNPLPGTEADGRYTIDPADGALVNSALTGAPIYMHRARLFTNTSNNLENLHRGLKIDDALSVTGVFDLTLQTLENERFGVRLTDRGTINGTGDDVVEVAMQMRDGGVRVVFREQDVSTSSYNIFDQIQFSAAALGLSDADFGMYDQISLFLTRPDASSSILGGFSLLDLDSGLGDLTYNFAGGATIFEGELFTRAEFLAVQVPSSSVPEASSLSMLGLGLFLLTGFMRRKQKAA